MNTVQNPTYIYEPCPAETTTNSHCSDNNLRSCLANYITNIEFPKDVYALLLLSLIIYLSLKLFQLSLNLVLSLIRPVVLLLIIVIVVPHLYEMKSWATNEIFSSLSSQIDGVIQYITDIFNIIYRRMVISLYPKIFV